MKDQAIRYNEFPQEYRSINLTNKNRPARYFPILIKQQQFTIYSLLKIAIELVKNQLPRDWRSLEMKSRPP